MRCDIPIQFTNQDSLNRKLAAEKFAYELVRSLTNPDSVTIGLHAPWGWGKTSFSNLIKLALEEISLPRNARQPKFLESSPMWYQDRTDLFSKFLVEISRQAMSSINSREAKLRWVKVFGAIAQAITERVAPLCEELTKVTESQLEDAKSISSLIAEAGNELMDANYQLWVFIDDMDRMQPADTLMFLSLLRSAGNLPWIRYLIAYDKEHLLNIVSSGLNAQHSQNEKIAKEFFHKYIQIEIDLCSLVDQNPNHAEAHSENSVTTDAEQSTQVTGLAEVVKLFAVQEYESNRFTRPIERIAWVRTYFEALQKGISQFATPRDFVRWYNACCWKESLIPSLLLDDVVRITTWTRTSTGARALFKTDGLLMAQAIYQAVREKHSSAKALLLARTFLAAWAGSVRAPKQQTSDGYEEIVKDTISENEPSPWTHAEKL